MRVYVLVENCMRDDYNGQRILSVNATLEGARNALAREHPRRIRLEEQIPEGKSWFVERWHIKGGYYDEINYATIEEWEVGE